ncbi:MAG TPA: Wzz/FepE/Etk N-terminal domain-containing protein [Gaiellaceae bacterium]
MRTEEDTRTYDQPLPDLEGEREVDLGRLGRTLVGRWWIVLLAIVVGALVGWLLSVGGGDVYTARATVYLGNPLSPSGNGSIQGLATNPATVNQIIHADSTVNQIAGQIGVPAGKLRGGISSKTITAGTAAQKAATTNQLIEISVRGPWRQQTAEAANRLAALVVTRTSTYVNQKIAGLEQELQSENRELAAIDQQIDAYDRALAGSSLSPIEKLTLVAQQGLAEQRRGQVIEQQTSTQELLQLAKQVEKGKVVTPAVARKVPARTSTSSIVVGAILGALVGIALAFAWDPLVRRWRTA